MSEGLSRLTVLEVSVCVMKRMCGEHSYSCKQNDAERIHGIEVGQGGQA